MADRGTAIEESDAPQQAGQLYRWTRGLTGSTQRFWFVLPGLVLIAGVSFTAVNGYESVVGVCVVAAFVGIDYDEDGGVRRIRCAMSNQALGERVRGQGR